MASSGQKVAIVTGASRGVGRGCALELAKAGYDLAICARTVHEGEQREHSSSVKRTDTSALPGSLDKTAQEIEALGRRALKVKLDLNEAAGADAAVAETVKAFGRVDVLVNNGRYVGPGHMDLFVDTPIETLEAHDRCNVIAPLRLIKACLPHMIAQGGGIVVNLVSTAGWQETPGLPGQGGWGLGYSISKAGINRIAPGLAKELKEHNIAVVNLDPGFVGTERIAQDMAGFGYTLENALTTDVPGKVLARIVTHRTPMFFSGTTVDTPLFAVEHELITGDEIPERYGPPTWGIPRPFKWKGEAASPG